MDTGINESRRQAEPVLNEERVPELDRRYLGELLGFPADAGWQEVFDAWRKEAATDCDEQEFRERMLDLVTSPGYVQLRDYWRASIAGEEFLHTYEWKRARYRTLVEQKATCACCGVTAKMGAVMNVDHIKPRARYPWLALDLGNLQVLCSECNWGKGNDDETDWRK